LRLLRNVRKSDVLTAQYPGIPLNIIKQKIMNITDYTLEEHVDETFEMCRDAIIR